MLFVVGCVLDAAHPTLVLAGVLRPVALAVPAAAVVVAAFVTFAGGLALAVGAQRTMGAAWQTGIDVEEPAGLVTRGPFAVVRNPTYTGLLMCSATVAVLVPTWLAAVAVVVCFAALEIQTRLVEEPHPQEVHGESYRRYTGRVGRFVPGIGYR